jgi:transposase-like protein
MANPKTLAEAIRYFADDKNCIRVVADMRWPNGPSCPACGHLQHYWLDTQKRWKCKECWKQFSVKVGTIFEDSPIALDKWLIALWMLVNCRNAVSSYEVARDLGVSQKAGWFMLQRLRLALQNNSFVKLGGPDSAPWKLTRPSLVVKPMHRSKRERLSRDGGVQGSGTSAEVTGQVGEAGF